VAKKKTAAPAAAAKGLDNIVLKASALQRLTIEYVPIDSIKPNAYNPNRQDEKEFKMLQESMAEDGFTQPIVVQRSTNEIVDGEHRWRAARAQGHTSVPVVFVNMTADQMRISTLRHNRARGAEDQELVTQVLRDLRELGALGWAQDALQMSDEDLNVLINDVPVSEALAAESFTEGWSPVRNLKEGESEKAEVRMHPSVSEMNKQLNERLARATSPEERQQIEAERRANTFRISCAFSADDAELITSALGSKPIETLLACCSAYERLNPPAEDEAA
jgi:ParB-like chromosome segregation protein Spo0J